MFALKNYLKCATGGVLTNWSCTLSQHAKDTVVFGGKRSLWLRFNQLQKKRQLL